MTDSRNHGTVPYLLNVTVTWNVTPCSLVQWHKHYRGTCCLRLQSRWLEHVGTKIVIIEGRDNWDRCLWENQWEKQTGKSLVCKGVTYCSTMQIQMQISPKHWSLHCHNRGHCNINSYPTETPKSHTYLLQSQASPTVTKHKAQSNANNVRCRSVCWKPIWEFNCLKQLPNPENQRESKFERTAVLIWVISGTGETILNTANAIHLLCRHNSVSCIV